MIHVIASIHIKDSRLDEFLRIFKANIPKVRSEKGCREYFPTRDVPTGLPNQELDNNVVTILEKWESIADLRLHLTAEHMLEYRRQVRDMVTKVNIRVVEEV